MRLLLVPLCFSISVITANAGVAQELPLPEPVPEHNQTSLDEVRQTNPIRLQASISETIPTLNRAMTEAEAVAIGLDKSPVAQSAREGFLAQRWLKRAALSRFGPSASLSSYFSASTIDQMLFFQNNDINPMTMQPITKGVGLHVLLGGYQPLFTGGRLTGNFKAASARERISFAEYQAERVRIALQIRQLYWEVVLDQEKLRVAQDYVRYREWSSANMLKRVEVGKSPRADYLREAAELAKARAALNDGYKQYNSALVKLKTLQGINVVSDVTAIDALETALTGAETMADYLNKAKLNHPELLKTSAKLNESRAQRTVVRSRYLPQVNAYGLASNATGKTPGEESTVKGKWGGTFGIVGGITLFDSGSREFEMRAAAQSVKQAELGRQQAELQISEAVSLAWIDLQTAQSNAELSKTEVTSAQEDHRLMHRRFEVGKATALEDFEASVKAFQTKLTHLEQLSDIRIAQAKLLAASGVI